MAQKRILVVDDDRFIRRAMRHLVERLGHQCLEAGAGDEGHQVAMAERPDLVLLDVMLPNLNGYEASRMIKEDLRKDPKARDIPILIVTARRTDSEEREEFLRTWSQARPFYSADLANPDLNGLRLRVTMPGCMLWGRCCHGLQDLGGKE